jgi:CRISPR-associated protein Cas6
VSSGGHIAEFVELVFPLGSGSLRMDYPLPLWQALRDALPWLAEDDEIAILPIKGGGFSEGRMILGQRARLTLRMPRSRIEEAQELAGQGLKFGLDPGDELRLGEPHVRALQPTSTQYSPMVVFGHDDEAVFLAECSRALEAMGVGGNLVCGKAQARLGEAGELRGFSLMLHGLSAGHALRLQQHGLGNARKIGCGIFVSHKTAAAVGAG